MINIGADHKGRPLRGVSRAKVRADICTPAAPDSAKSMRDCCARIGMHAHRAQIADRMPSAFGDASVGGFSGVHLRLFHGEDEASLHEMALTVGRARFDDVAQIADA